ncbi:CBS domain-containing protein [Sphingomonas sp. 1P06PA]|uniref:CBS domain-containing protein n=1 Tax=Sphingomonas sp. 1P06PA TaxID=554121 RepID=UPI0039A6D9DD
MTISTILRGKGSEVVSIATGTRVTDVVQLLAQRRIGAVPVVDGDAVVGIISERDILYLLAAEGATALDRPVDAVMTAPAITIEPELGILQALSLMTKRRIRHLPVVDASGMVGFVSIGDLVKARIDRIEEEAAALRDYIQMA